MKEIQRPKRKFYAKKVVDLIEPYMLPRVIDRTKQPHKYKFDVDVRSLKSPREKRDWIYWGSHRTIEECLKVINKAEHHALESFTDVRIVESKTGLVVKYFKL